MVAIYARASQKARATKSPQMESFPNVGTKVKKGGVIYLLRSSYA
jgi:hypothetical protein